jgi:uncharacterized protein YbjT (DUF2867 family)
VRIAVTGATRQLGRQVAGILAATGQHQVVAVSRRPGLLPGPGVRAAVADYADPLALREALRGVDNTSVRLQRRGGSARAAAPPERDPGRRRQRIGHIVALSGLDADLGSPFCYAVTYGYSEQLLYRSGCAVSSPRRPAGVPGPSPPAPRFAPGSSGWCERRGHDFSSSAPSARQLSSALSRRAAADGASKLATAATSA